MSSPYEIQGSGQGWSTALVGSIASACLTSVLYGYHMAELNALNGFIKTELNATDPQIGLVTAIFSIGGLISSTAAATLSTRRGMKTSFAVTSVFYIVGAFAEARAVTYLQILFGRFVSGLGGGLAIVFVPLYVNEVSPLHLRGFLGSMTQVTVNSGILLTQGLAIKWASSTSWRSVLWTGLALACVSLMSALLFLEESPRWLVLNQEDETQGREVLVRLRNGDSGTAEWEIESWKQEQRVHSEAVAASGKVDSVSLYAYLTDSTYSKSRGVATFIMLFQQFSGINAVIFYGVKILSSLFPGWAVSLNFLIGVGNTLVTIVASLFLDSVGRKPMLCISSFVMGICSVGMSAGILLNSPVLTVVSVFAYVGSFAVGCGPIPFLLVSEVSQIEVRDIAQGWATDVNWLSVFAVGFLFPVLNQQIGGYVYLLFAAVSFIFAAFTNTYIPETKGRETYAEVWDVRED